MADHQRDHSALNSESSSSSSSRAARQPESGAKSKSSSSSSSSNCNSIVNEDDDDETIEFEIEIASNNSSSKQGSLSDLRDCDDGDRHEEEIVVEEALQSQPQAQLQLELTSQVEQSPPIVDITSSHEQETTAAEGTESGVAAADATAAADDEDHDDDDDEQTQMLADVLENSDCILETDEAQSYGSSQQAAFVTSIEIANDFDNGFEPAEIDLSQQKEVTETQFKTEADEEVNEKTEERSTIPIANQDEEGQTVEPVVEEMKLQPLEASSETTTPPNTHTNKNQTDLRQLSTSAAEFELFSCETIEAALQRPTDDEFAQLESTENTTGTPEDRPQTCDSVRADNYIPIESVGSRSIREIYKVLDPGSEFLLSGCRPELANRALPQAEPLPALEEAQEECLEQQQQQQQMLQETQLEPSDEQQEPQSPKITIERSPELTALPEIERLEQKEGSAGDESEDLEWEFDHEPPFEKRDVEVKRNQDPRDEYELGSELGRGKFGTVFKCTHKENGKQLAAKFVLTRRKEDREDVEREVSIMSRLQHKRLLQLYDAFDNGTNEMCLVTELVEGGELFERIIDDDFDLTEKKAAIFMRQICEGVEYMHSQNIVHLDMKPENILCSSRTGNRIKLIDFGLARQLNPNEQLRVMFGTPDFAAPEVLCYETVSLATDMWSVGVICYVLLSGLSPFMGNTDMETMANVTRATYDFDEASFDPISDLAKDFISKLLVRDQTKRLVPAECLQHAWLARGGAQLEAAVRERRNSRAIESLQQLPEQTESRAKLELLVSSMTVSLDKRNLKKYVVRRKWHKTVHAIMALGRMGAKLKASLIA